MGLMRDFYINSFVFRFVCLLLASKVLSIRSRRFNCNLFTRVYCAQVSLRSRVKPWYFTVGVNGIWVPKSDCRTMPWLKSKSCVIWFSLIYLNPPIILPGLHKGKMIFKIMRCYNRIFICRYDKFIICIVCHFGVRRGWLIWNI